MCLGYVPAETCQSAVDKNTKSSGETLQAAVAVRPTQFVRPEDPTLSAPSTNFAISHRRPPGSRIETVVQSTE